MTLARYNLAALCVSSLLLASHATTVGAAPLVAPQDIGVTFIDPTWRDTRTAIDLQLAQSSAPADSKESAKESISPTAETVQALKRTFQEQLLGKSVAIGVADVLTGASLVTQGGTFESYTGPDLYTPAFAFNSSSAHGLVFREYDAGGFHFLDTLNFLANYAQFNADTQTVQKLSGGRSPGGFVRGDFLYGVALFGYNGIHEGPSVNWGFRAGVGLGAALAQFDGRVDYAAGSQNRSETFSHGYDQPLLTYVMLIEGRFGNIVVSGQSVQIYADARTNQTHTHFNVELGLVTLQVSYAFYL